VGLQNDFDGGFFSSDLGVIKSQPEFFERVANELQVGPEHIDYWDDDPGNVEVASKSGINANVYKEFEQFKEEVSK
jgi:FMN phosphatase YigB (HAD superfamily)